MYMEVWLWEQWEGTCRNYYLQVVGACSLWSVIEKGNFSMLTDLQRQLGCAFSSLHEAGSSSSLSQNTDSALTF